MLRKIIVFVKRQVKIFKIKWVKGQCHRMCAWCEYRHECLEHLE